MTDPADTAAADQAGAAVRDALDALTARKEQLRRESEAGCIANVGRCHCVLCRPQRTRRWWRRKVQP